MIEYPFSWDGDGEGNLQRYADRFGRGGAQMLRELSSGAVKICRGMIGSQIDSYETDAVKRFRDCQR
jgi:hypothetical protein